MHMHTQTEYFSEIKENLSIYYVINTSPPTSLMSQGKRERMKELKNYSISAMN